jgi:cell division protein FtsI/penicillin-binding protein 2
MKLITAQAALNQGVDLHYRCQGHEGRGKNRQTCWLPTGHGSLDLPKALALSCNLYFSQLGTRVGWDPLLKVLAEYSLSPGKNISKTDATLRKFSIGEDTEFTVTPLQVEAFWEKYLRQLDQGKLQAIQEGLQRAALEGTAKGSAAFDPPGLPILAKTGTAEAVGEPYKTHGWFLGATPTGDPEWALMIFLKNAHGYREPTQLAGEVFKQL